MQGWRASPPASAFQKKTYYLLIDPNLGSTVNRWMEFLQTLPPQVGQKSFLLERQCTKIFLEGFYGIYPYQWYVEAQDPPRHHLLRPIVTIRPQMSLSGRNCYATVRKMFNSQHS